MGLLGKEESETGKKIDEKLKENMKQQEKYVDNQIETLEAHINESASKVNEFNSKMRETFKEFNDRLRQLEIETDDIRARAMGQKSRIANIFLIICGVAFCAAALLVLLTTFNGVVSIDSMIMTMVLAFAGVFMLFVSTIV